MMNLEKLQLEKIQSRDDFDIGTSLSKYSKLKGASSTTVNSFSTAASQQMEDGKSDFSDTPPTSEVIPAEPKKYMTAVDFERRVCNQLQFMSKSLEKTAKRYEKAIEVTEKTIKTC